MRAGLDDSGCISIFSRVLASTIRDQLDTKPSVLIPFIGGLGNQLFQLCGGLFLKSVKKRNTSFTDRLLTLANHSLVERRTLMIQSLLKSEELADYSRLYVSAASLISRFENNRFAREINPADDVLWKTGPKTRFVLGFFQRDEYVSAVWDALTARMNESPEFRGLLVTAPQPTIVLHVRRGDYLNPRTQQFHGLSSNTYFEKACQQVMDRTRTPSITVVSDDIDGAVLQLKTSQFFSNADITFRKGLNEIQTLRLMSSARGVVASNSSFSWWGARICWALNDGLVAVPTPWFSEPGSIDSYLHPNDDRWMVIPRELEG